MCVTRRHQTHSRPRCHWFKLARYFKFERNSPALTDSRSEIRKLMVKNDGGMGVRDVDLIIVKLIQWREHCILFSQ
jgi:hypothetical protein